MLFLNVTVQKTYIQVSNSMSKTRIQGQVFHTSVEYKQPIFVTLVLAIQFEK